MSSRSGLAVQGGSSAAFESRKYCCLDETTFESAALFAGTQVRLHSLCWLHLKWKTSTLNLTRLGVANLYWLHKSYEDCSCWKAWCSREQSA
jgi:hypothetical protein